THREDGRTEGPRGFLLPAAPAARNRTLHWKRAHRVPRAAARNPKFSASRTSRTPVLPVKFSIVRGGLGTLRKLLRFRPQFGSPRCDESLAAARLAEAHVALRRP